jgi:periplasmic protein TonB
VFEQSLLLNQDTRRPWNFLASLTGELLVISLALLIPLAFSDHLPGFHLRDITVGPAPLAPPLPQPAKHESVVTSATPSTAQYRTFFLDPRASLHQAQAVSIDLAPDAPPTLGPGLGVGGSTNTLGTFISDYVAAPPPPKPIVEGHKQPSAPIPVGGDVQMAKLLRKVIPLYPPIARSAGISGVVQLIGTISKDGTIRDLQLVSGHPMLARAAMEAVQQWVYRPTMLNGNPVEVIAPIEVRFTLGH